MNWIDLIIAGVLMSFIIRGLWRGFFRELFSLVGLFLGLWIALLKFVPLGEWLQKRFPLTEPLPFHVAFLVIFLGVSFVASIVGYLLHRTAKGVFLGWLDAVAGSGFGFVKGVMILTVLLFFLMRLPLAETIRAQLQTSSIATALEHINPFLERSVRTYQRFGGEYLWERLRAPEPFPFPTLGERRPGGNTSAR